MTIRFAPAVPLSTVRKLAADIGCHLVNDGRGDVIITPRAEVEFIAVTRAGDCDLCGHWDGALAQGACKPCREKYRLQS